MNRYWPSRNPPEGFSIEKLARSYRDKLSQRSLTETEVRFSEPSSDGNESFTENISGNIFISKGSRHWANRSFEEYYLDAA